MNSPGISKPSERVGRFRGWHVVGGGFLNSMLLIGATIYSFGLFVNPVEQQFGLSREQANLGYVALLVGFALWAPVVGKLLGRFDVRTVSCVGAGSFAAGMVALSVTQTPWLLGLLILIPVAFGVVAAGAFTANTVVTRWFFKLRGRALGIVAIATSVGGFIIPPIFAALLTEFGWQLALAIMGIGVGILASLSALLLLRNKPSDIGNVPDGKAADADSIPAVEQPPLSAAQIGRSRNFWLVAVGVGLLLGSDQAVLTSLVPYGIDRGFTLAEATFLISALTGSAIIGKLILGWLCDRIDKRYLFVVVVACNLAFLAVLLLESGYIQLLIAAAIIGLAVGGVYPVWTSLTADCFGSGSFGIAYGLMNIVAMPCALISVLLAGRSFDQTGSYSFAFAVFITLDILAALLVFAVRGNARVTRPAESEMTKRCVNRMTPAARP
ncbi:MAG: MFS transporter [Sphingomonadales bacterium]|nr:MFS transporter [Sphingomonadales bacterium]